MTIEFRKVTQQVRLLDPRENFAETSLSFDLRTDPLTHQTGRVISYRFALPEKPDLSGLIEMTQKMCPFCPEVIEQFAARFPKDFIPEGKISRGEVTVVPNLMPYSKYGAVAAISKKHFISLDGFTNDVISEGLMACQSYFAKVLEYDSEAKYYSMGWNYMPVAGGSIVHPHLQAEADTYPFHYQGKLFEASMSYTQTHSSNYWADLVNKEKELGERYIDNTGSVVWLAPYLPRGKIYPDVMAIFCERDSMINITETEWRDFATGLCRVLNYLSDQNFYSCNMALYSGLLDQDYFWTHVRITPRGTFPPLDVSDHDHIQRFQDEYCACRLPEEVCTELQEYFNSVP